MRDCRGGSQDGALPVASRAPGTALRGRLWDLANERRKLGYRRLFVLLRREGEASVINRIYRLYGLARFLWRAKAFAMVLEPMAHHSLVCMMSPFAGKTIPPIVF